MKSCGIACRYFTYIMQYSSFTLVSTIIVTLLTQNYFFIGNQTQTIALTIRITYTFEVTCIDAFKENIETTLETKLKDLPSTWPGLDWCGTQCVWNAECRGTYADVSFTLPGLK